MDVAPTRSASPRGPAAVAALLAEAAFPFIAAQLYIWLIPRDRERWIDVAFGVAVAAVVVSYVVRRGVTPRTFGVQRDDAHRRAALPVALFTTAVIAALLVGGWLTEGWSRGGLRQDWDLLAALAAYPIWGFVQQGVLLGVAYPRFRKLLAPLPAALAVGLLFLIAHLPNPLLMFGGAGMAIFYAIVWERAPSLPVIALSHGFIGAVCDKALHVSMRVGSNYLG